MLFRSAYNKEEFGKTISGDSIYDVQIRGFRLVHEYFCEAGSNSNYRTPEELYVRFHKIVRDVEEFVQIMEVLRQGCGSFVHTVVHDASHQWLQWKKELFPFAGCYRILIEYPDRANYYTGLKRNFRI